jgi:DNA-directed RNA polymerase subunit beta
MLNTQKNIKVVERKNFSKIKKTIEPPDLVEIQKDSFKAFLQADVDIEKGEKRKHQGLEEVFQEIFPITDFNESSVLEYVDYKLDEPKYSPRESIDRNTTYASPLKVRVRLVTYASEDNSVEQAVEAEIYLCDIPLMTELGTFVINGVERVVVNQLHRSPGIFFEDTTAGKSISEKHIYSARIIPYRGSWLDFEYDAKNMLYVRIDKKRKISATVLLKALNLSEREIIAYYYKKDTVVTAGEGLYSIPLFLDGDEIDGTSFPVPILDKDGNELVEAGAAITKLSLKKLRRAKEAGKLEDRIVVPAQALEEKYFADDFGISGDKPLVEINTAVTPEKLALLASAGITSFEILRIDRVSADTVVRDMLAADKSKGSDEARIEIYRRLRPGEPANVESAQTLFTNLFFNEKRYDLSKVGRVKINVSLDLKTVSEDITILTKDDILETVRKLERIRLGRDKVDDIDHLGHRRVKAAGEQLQNHIRIGLARMEKTVKERMSMSDPDNMNVQDLLNVKPLSASIKEFFGGYQLSQFMDQTNPLSEVTHKRRLSALGPGGLNRDRAGFEVRDVHTSHYGRICPIETPEGPNIGLITSLTTYARIDEYGFIETPYRKVVDGVVTDETVYMSPIEEQEYYIAQANEPLDKKGSFLNNMVASRYNGDSTSIEKDKINYMDVAPMQIVSISTALIPFLEHDDANRALMGSNMQRQAVPLIRTEAPIVGTGLERKVASDAGSSLIAASDGVVDYVDSSKIILRHKTKEDGNFEISVYDLVKYRRSNQDTCINFRPTVDKDQFVKKGDSIADGAATDRGELALGHNTVVAFMPWMGYNYEDSILISEKLVKEDAFTSIHIEVFDTEARDTKLGQEEITRDMPNIAEETLKDLDESGIIRIGAKVKAGDILVGKITPKGETQASPEEKLLRAIFGDKARDMKDASLRVPPGISGTVLGVQIMTRRGVDKCSRAEAIEDDENSRAKKDYELEKKALESARKYLLIDWLEKEGKNLKLSPAEKQELLKRWFKNKPVSGKPLPADELEKLSLEEFAKFSLSKANASARAAILSYLNDGELTRQALEALDFADLSTLPFAGKLKKQYTDFLSSLNKSFKKELDKADKKMKSRLQKLERGDELAAGVLKVVRVFIAIKRKLSVGDKMAGRHGNKGVVSRVLPEEDMPYLPDGTPVEIVLNPLSIPSRMNVGQVLEMHLGWAAKKLSEKGGKKLFVATEVFDGAKEADIKQMLKQAGVQEDGQTVLYDGRTGEPFDQEVTVGVMYMLKLHHLVDTKIHARSTGPYSLVTQQPLGGKAQFGGQRLGEMEVWALQAYGAANILQEMLTVKSDDTEGRTDVYQAIVNGNYCFKPNMPESFNVLIKELQGLCLDMELISEDDAGSDGEKAEGE